MTVCRASRIYWGLLLLALLLGVAWLAGAEVTTSSDTSQTSSHVGSDTNTGHAHVTGQYSASFAALMYTAYR
jgi:hypothetical protein